MLVTFRTSAYADITMFGTAAVSLLKLMGHSGTVPGALLAADIPDALERLQAAIAAGGADTPERTEVADSDEDRDEDLVVSVGSDSATQQVQHMIIIVGIGSFLLAAVVRWWMTRTYKIWGGVANRIGAHGHATARHILDSNGLQHVTLERSKDYWPLRAKAMLMPMAAAGHRFGLLLMMGGGLGGLPVLLNLGVVMLTGAVLVQLLTLPIEFDASRRALDELTRLKLVDEQELSGAKTMLTAAALTYVASAASSLAVSCVFCHCFCVPRRGCLDGQGRRRVFQADPRAYRRCVQPRC